MDVSVLGYQMATKSNETVLFLHTGGQPALFAEQYADEFKWKPRFFGEKMNKIVD
jgi:hypothetical protein